MSLKFTDLKQDGYERVLLAEDHITGFYSIIAIHNTKRGPALGDAVFLTTMVKMIKKKMF